MELVLRLRTSDGDIDFPLPIDSAGRPFLPAVNSLVWIDDDGSEFIAGKIDCNIVFVEPKE